MDDGTSPGSLLEAVAGTAGPAAIEAFELLGNETRLAILLALWEAYEPLTDDNTVRFSELRDRVGVRQGAQFNYHLDKLVGRFVNKTDDGYELRASGQTLVRAVIAGAGLEEPTSSRTELELSCHRCGDGRVEISYQDEVLYLNCQECEGFMITEEFPQGTLAAWEFDPAGLDQRDPAELLVGGLISTKHRIWMMSAGICPDCSGAIDSRLQLCEDHHPGPREVCPNCGKRDSARVRHVCTVCKNWEGGPVQVAVADHPAVIGFYDDHGVDMRVDIDDFERFTRVWGLIWDQEHTIVSTDPVRIRVTVPCEGDELQLMLDEELDVIDVSENN